MKIQSIKCLLPFPGRWGIGFDLAAAHFWDVAAVVLGALLKSGWLALVMNSVSDFEQHFHAT